MNDDERPDWADETEDDDSAAREPAAGSGGPDQPPAAITHLVRERAEARAARDWDRADRLKQEIEEAGWKVVDSRGRTTVKRAAPANVEAGGRTRYGSWRTVPSRLAEPARRGATIVTVASEDPEATARLLSALERHAPAATQVVVVANDPSAAQERALEEIETAGPADANPAAGDAETGRIEVVWTSARLGYAAAVNIGVHRATGEIVIVADGSAWPTGDAVTPVEQALADPAVGAAGAFGLVSTDARVLRPSAIVRTDAVAVPDVPVVALEAGWLGFRRSDFAAFGPIDEHFITPAWMDVWWSLRLRVGEIETDDEAVSEATTDEPTADEPASDADEATRDELETSRIGPDAAGTTGLEPDVPGSTGPADADEPGTDEPGTDDDGVDEDADDGVDADDWTPRLALQLDLPLNRVAPVWPPERIRFNRRNAYRVIDDFAGLPELLAGSGTAAAGANDVDDEDAEEDAETERADEPGLD